MKPLHFFSVLFTFWVFAACQQTLEPTVTADLVFWGGPIYTGDALNSTTDALAVAEGKIIALGSKNQIEKYVAEGTRVFDLAGQTLTPGFIESHAHLMGIGYNRLNLDFMKVRNWAEIIDQVKKTAENTPEGEWILGRGWHQDKWDELPEKMVQGFPVHDLLSEAAPHHPVYLRHASGHASIANAKAMELAGITAKSRAPEGGEVIKDAAGNPTGLMNETAQGMIGRVIPESTPEKDRKALSLAIEECLANGITSFHDAGAGQGTLDLYQEFLDEGKLDIRLWVMLSGRDTELLNSWYERGPLVDPNGHLTVRAIKVYADGALGSRGAWLLEAYTDDPATVGMATTPMETVQQIALDGLKNGFQVCTHAIGDRANREVLNRYQKAFKAFPDQADDHRFRIEHAQHIHPEDIPRFGELGVIASMQGIHMASDRPWAIDRLGELRIKQGAYVWRKLLETGAVIINGTDAPVEPVSAIACFYASVTRKTLKKEPMGGYEADQRMTREEALRSYTLDAAYGAFEEDIKGSLEVGKVADFVVFDRDSDDCPRRGNFGCTGELYLCRRGDEVC